MDPSAAKSQYARAQELFQSGQLDEALRLLSALTQQFPDNKNLLYAHARCLAKLGRADEARTICKNLVAGSEHPQAQKLLEKLGESEDSDLVLDSLGELLYPLEQGPPPARVSYELTNKDKLIALFVSRSFLIIAIALAVIIGVYFWQLRLLDNRNWGGIDTDDPQLERTREPSSDSEN